MKKHRKRQPTSDISREYDFRSGQRGKYAKRYQKGTNVVVLDPDVARVFSNPRAVNEVLRSLSKIIQRHTGTELG